MANTPKFSREYADLHNIAARDSGYRNLMQLQTNEMSGLGRGLATLM